MNYSFAEIHAAAKETVALAEERFMSNSHEWQFDNAWQEMLNHATLKVRTTLGKAEKPNSPKPSLFAVTALPFSTDNNVC